MKRFVTYYLLMRKPVSTEISERITSAINTEECHEHITRSIATLNTHVRNSIVQDLELSLHGCSTENNRVCFIVSYK